MMISETKVVLGCQAMLMVVAGVSMVRFMGSETWVSSVSWWAMTIVFLFSFWVLGVHRIIRFSILVFSGLALVRQCYTNMTVLTLGHTSHGAVVVEGVAIMAMVAVTWLMAHVQYAADAVWSVKTIVVDWLVCTSLLVILSCVDALQGKRYLILAVAYFCTSNIFSVMVMKVCEMLMIWRSPRGAPCAKYIHNLSIPITVLPSLHAGQLLAVAWALVFMLWGKAVDPSLSAGVHGWQVMAASGLWGSLLCYVCPIIANKNPTPYQPTPRATSQQRRQQQS